MKVIIDGDVLVHLATLPRWRMKARIEDGISYIDLNPGGDRAQYEFTEMEDRLYLEKCWDNFLTRLDEMLDDLFADKEDVIMAVKAPLNFRDVMYPEYKQTNSRKKARGKNPFLAIIRERAVSEGYAIFADGMEADDMLRIWAEQCRKMNEDFVICSIDKDLHCIEGRHYYMKRGETAITRKTANQAMRHYYKQLLMGDNVDNIPGVPGLGPVTADNALMYCKTEADMQEQVVGYYIGAYPETWRDWLMSNGKMIHIMSTPTDYFRNSHWPIMRELNIMDGYNVSN